ncbi:hypothetical protein NP493_595g01036 [Ridgeia piscesae]|uniref:Uncharacterized protein n=1 Tax=Ridgeia piscesae TaxID=27915 RepID=A0AAD9KU30_RIDPI|nr:hypothetical protein NP493_595g01036 [Ridgeia piscesae]
MSKQKDERKTRHWHMIDFIIIWCRDKMDIHNIRAMRGANCRTVHQILRSKLAFRIRQKHNRQGTSKPTNFNTAKLSTITHRERFEQEMYIALDQWEEKESFNTRLGMGSSAADRIQYSQDISCKRVVARWSEHFQKLLNIPGDTGHDALDNIPQHITKTSVDEIPTTAEKARAITGLKDGKAPGEMEYLLKYGSTEQTICSANCVN